MEGLEDYIQYVLLNLHFDDFNHLVDSALNTECKYLEMEDKKRKITPVASGSNTRPRLQPPSSTSSSSTGRPSSTSSGHSSTRLDSSSRQVRARGYRHLRLVLLHQLRQHRRLHGRQLLLPDSRLQPLLACAITAAIRGTTPTLSPGRRRRDSRGTQLSPGHHFRGR